MADKVTVDITTGIGTLCFPKVFPDTAVVKDDGKKSYEIQILIDKKNRDDVRALLAAVKKVGEAKWGDKYKSVKMPLRDGDREKDELTEDGSTKGEKYPERLGHYFINARSTRPVSVVDRTLTPIVDEGELYAGCKGKIAVNFYAYSSNGNHGIAAGLNGVQKIADGEPIGGGGKPSVDSMFDVLDDDLDLDLEDEVEEEAPKPAKKTAAKKTAAKKTASSSRRKAAPVEEIDDDDLEEDDDDMFDDLED